MFCLDCHQGQNVTVLAIIERLELKTFLSTIMVDNTFERSMASPLSNPFRRHYYCNINCRMHSEPKIKHLRWTFLQIINGYKDKLKTLSTSEMELFPQIVAGCIGELRI